MIFSKLFKQVFLSLVLLLTCHSLSLAQPANDDCATATPLPCGTNAMAGSTNASASEPTPGCASNYGVWYTFTGDGNSTTLTVQNVSLDTEMALFSGSCGSLTNITCEDAVGAMSPEIYTFTSVVGVTYYVYVAYYGSGTTTGDFTISRDCYAPPVNDDCVNATPLPCGTSALAGSTNASISEPTPGCASNYGVWYSFPGDGNNTTLTVQNVSLDTEMALFSGSCGSLTNITCEDAVGAMSPETYTFTSVIGVTYYVYVAYYGSGTTTGDFTISRDCYAPPANDDCANATPLPCGTSALAGSTNASASEPTPGCASNYGVWYTFAGDGNSMTLTVQNVSLDTEMALFSGSCGSLTNITCEDAVGAMSPETYTFNSVVGVTYYVYVAYYGSGTTTGDFTISRDCYAPPVNDDCVNATTLPCGTSTLPGSTIASAPEVSPGCGSDYGVWYTFAGDGDVTTLTLQNVSLDTELAVFSGSCGSLTNITCEDAVGAMSPETFVLSTTVGTTYYVYVAYYGSGTTVGDFTISRDCSVASAADCAGAQQICDDQTFTSNSSGYGAVQELNPSNYGCWAGGVSLGEDQSSWYYFQATYDDTIQFTLIPSNPATDYDFILWGPNSSCATLGAPIRCNAAGTSGNTGMVTNNPVTSAPVTNTSSAPGFASSVWIQSLPVQAGETYIMMINNFTTNSEPFDFDWDIPAGLLNCVPTPLPVELESMKAEKVGSNNYVFWGTLSENNNNYFTLERSTDGENWNFVSNISSVNNSIEKQSYSYKDSYYRRNAINYYRLSQTDFNGDQEYLGVRSIDNRDNASTVIQIVDLSGRVVNENYRGVVLVQYSDGTVVREFR